MKHRRIKGSHNSQEHIHPGLERNQRSFVTRGGFLIKDLEENAQIDLDTASLLENSGMSHGYLG